MSYKAESNYVLDADTYGSPLYVSHLSVRGTVVNVWVVIHGGAIHTSAVIDDGISHIIDPFVCGIIR